jgi:type VI secretion system secreted protein Hcp
MNRLLKLMPALALLSLLWLPPSAGAAMNAYLELELNGSDVIGESQVTAIGGIDVAGHLECIGFNHEMFLAGAARPTHGPVKFIKRVDAASPLLYLGWGNNQPGEATFRFFRKNSDDGTTEHYFTIRLEQVRIAGIRHWFPNTTDPVGAELPQMEEISLTYSNITVTHEIANTEATLNVNTATGH